MGRMIDGVWRRDAQLAPASGDGAFIRPDTSFRDLIEPGGRFAPEAGRYHLYVSLACPWAHRTLIFRALKRLEPFVSVSITHWLMG
jgi:putative glutathione S-transferase